MKRRPVLAVLMLLLWGSAESGCSAPNPHVRVRRLKDGRLQVEGPLAGPFKNTEELAAVACELMTRQPGAASGSHGFEYCALHYYSPNVGGYFLSYLSDIRDKLDSVAAKTCSMPQALHDPSHDDAIIAGGSHTHPHNRKFSPVDLKGNWRPVRIPIRATGSFLHRELMLFFRERTGECRAYKYNYAKRIVSALRSGRWVDIGQTYGERGDLMMFEGEDWVPRQAGTPPEPPRVPSSNAP